MTLIDWDHIRGELAAAHEMVKHELNDGHDSPDLRVMAADHVKTALLLLSGLTMGLIIGHPAGAHHDEGEADAEDTLA